MLSVGAKNGQMDSIGVMAEQLSSVLEPLAAMIVRKIKPSDDDMSMRAAQREYGFAWVNDHARRGNIEFRAKGKRQVVSRTQLELLRASEMRRACVVSRLHNNDVDMPVCSVK